MAALTRLGALAALIFASCGDAQYGGAYRGEPIWQYKGSVQVSGPGVEGLAGVRVAVFYSPHDLNATDPGPMVEHLASAVGVPVPSSFVLNIFEPPGPEHMFKSPDGSDAGYALGHIFVYQDQNGDGRYTAGERVLGSEQAKAILYVPAPLPANRNPTGSALPAGFLKVIVPQSCGFAPPPPTDPGTCGVPLGARCSLNADCGQSGLCLSQAKEFWIAGYCIVPDPTPSGCRPARSVYLQAIQASPGPMGVVGYYLRPCTQDADCVRPGDPESNFYTCDQGLRGCTPTPPAYIPFPVGGTAPPAPTFCAHPQG